MPFQLIDTPAALEAFCGHLDHRDWIALDTEFMREKSYYPQLCLLQVASDSHIACIDPLAVSLEPLLERLYAPGTRLVLHAARQDLEILHHLTGELPQQVFDTQLAATVLGHGDQIGYGNLVKAMLGLDLEKGHARTDWSHRPLSQEQLRYAADDVRYLGALYAKQIELLERHQRMHWLTEDFATLTAVETYMAEPDTLWRRLKGAGKLQGHQLAVLRELAEWREREAMAQDRPRRWILRDELLIDLARLQPANEKALERMRGFEPGVIRRSGAALLEAIRRGKATPKADWPVLSSPRRLTPLEEATVDTCMAVVKLVGLENAVSPAAIGSRREMEQLVRGERQVPILSGWRRSLVGEKLLGFLEGRTRLIVREGTLILEG